MSAILEDASRAGERSRRIQGSGTDEAEWRSCPQMMDARAVDLDAWVARYPRIWIVSPHPDDEVLALGATMARLSRRGADLRVVSVTAGAASHPGSARWPEAALLRVRPAELRRALDVLDIAAKVFELSLPDGDVTRHRDVIKGFLAQQVAVDDLIVAPWRWDGHPDHEATSEAAARAAERIGADLVEYPVWMWHWATVEDDRIPWTRGRCVRLNDDERDAKREAIRQFVSQVTPDVAFDPPRAAILPPNVVARFTRPFEVFFC